MEGDGLERSCGGSDPAGVTSCVTLGSLLNLSVCFLAHLYNETSKGTQFTELYEE